MREKPSPPSYEEARLLDALEQEGCPICHQVAGSDRTYFWWFFVEKYYELHVLDELARSLGFCWTHGTWLAGRPGSAFQLTAVHAVLVRRVRAVVPGRADGKRGLDLLRPAICPACRDRQDLTERICFWLARIVEKRAEGERYGNPGLLCLPHLLTVAPRLSRETLERVLTIHESAMASAGDSLGELRAHLDATAADGRPDLVKALLPSLHLAVGHRRGPEMLTRPARSAESRGTQDPIRRIREWVASAEACPVCLEVDRAWVEWLDWLDEAAPRRLALDDVLPTCPEHVWATVSGGGPYLAVAAAERALDAAEGHVATTLRWLRPAPVKRPPERLSLFQRLDRTLWEPGRRVRTGREYLAMTLRCPVCRRLAVATERTLSLLFALLEDRHQRAALERGYGLCFKHFSRALTLDAQPAVRESLAAVQAARLAEHEWELEECLRKSAWDCRPETKGAEESAWRRAVLRFSGSPGGSGP